MYGGLPALPGAFTCRRVVDHVIPRVPVRQWVLSFPISLRILFAAHPELLAPVLRIVHRVIASFPLKLEGLLDKIIVRLMKMFTRQGHLVEEEGTWMRIIRWRHCKRPRAPIASRWGRAPTRRC
jgi:hypothetical protein